MKWVTVVLAVALVWLQHDLWLAKGGWRDMWRLEAEAENQRQANQSLVLRNQAGDTEVRAGDVTLVRVSG